MIICILFICTHFLRNSKETIRRVSLGSPHSARRSALGCRSGTPLKSRSSVRPRACPSQTNLASGSKRWDDDTGTRDNTINSIILEHRDQSNVLNRFFFFCQVPLLIITTRSGRSTVSPTRHRRARVFLVGLILVQHYCY